MTGTFKTKTRVYTSPEFFTPITGRKSFIDAAVDFRRGLIENSSMAVLDADLAVKAAMGAGLSSSTTSIGQSAQGGSPDTDGKKRVNRGGVPGMDEDEEGYRYMPESTWGPGKVLKLFPSREERQSSNKIPNFGFVDKDPVLTPEQFVQQMEQKPKIRMSKYKINTRTGEPMEDTEVEFDRMRFGKTFKLNPDVSDEIDENTSEEVSGEMQEKSLGSTLKQRMPGASIAGRAAARFGVIMDELGKMRCPPGTPAANQFTDMTGSNCFGATPGNIISEAINLAQRLVPDDDPRRSSGFTRGIANFLFDMENGIFGNNVWYHADGTRMKHGEWRKFREAGGVAKNERWMVNGVERVYAELDAQDARMADLYAKLGIDVSDVKKATNEHLYEAFKKLKESGVITTEILGRPSPAQVEAMMTARLKNMDAHWIARTDDEKRILLNIEVQRYRELERAHLEAFLDEVIKNPEHMRSIPILKMAPGGRDRASFGVDDVVDGVPVGSINIDIPNTMAFQDSLLPNLSPDERLRIWAEGGQSDAIRAMAVKDFLVNSNSHAGQMMAMVDGGRGLGRHDMKHEIAHSIQAAAIFEHMKRELDASGSLIIPGGDKKKDTIITSVDELTAKHLMLLMTNESYMGIDIEALSNLRSRADVVAFLAGRYIWETVDTYGGKRRASEIGAELWALRSSGLVFGDDIDAALEYMDDIVSGKITVDRDVSDSILTRRIYEDHLDGSRRVREAREARERAVEYRDAAEAEAARLAEEAGSADAPDGEFFDADERAAEARMSAAREAYAQEKRAEVKAAKEAAKTMSEEEMIDFLAESTEASDALSELLDAADDAGEETSWMSIMDRDTLDAQTKAVADEWVKRFTVRRSPEAMEKLQNMIDEKRESRGSLSPDKIEERRYREFIEGATDRAKDMGLAELVQHYSDWEELATGEGVDGPERIRRKQMRDMYRDEYVKRRTEGPDSVSKEDARKEFNSKFKEIRKPKTVAEKEKKTRVKPKKFTSHKGKNGAHTFATEERARLMEGATTAEKVAFVEMGSGDTDAINMMIGHDEGMAAARAIQRRNTRLKKNGILPDGLNQHEASIEEQIENFYIPLIELMDKSSLSQTVEMHIDSDDDAAKYVEELLNGGMPVGSGGIGTGTLVTDKTDFSDGKKIIIRVPEGSRALLPDWSYYSESDNGEQKMMIPPSKFHLVEIREDGTVVLEVGEQKGTEEILKEAVEQIGYSAGDGDRAYREGLQKKVSKIVDRRIAERRKQGMFDPRKNSPIEEERFTTTADTAASGAGFTPDRPLPAPSRIDTGGKPKTQRGLKRRQSSTAMGWIIDADSWKQPSQAQDALDEIHAYITGEGAYQSRQNSTGLQVRGIMQKAFGTQNISELTEEQKYDLIDLISERMTNAPKDQQRGLSQAKSKIQDHVDISKMISSKNYSDPYATSDFDMSNMDFTPFTPIRGRGNDRLSSGAKWGQMPASNEQLARLLEPSNNDGFNEIYGPPQTREERITQMAEMQSEVMTSLREMFDNVPGAGDSLGLDLTHIDPVLADFIKNSSDQEIYKLIAESAKNLHESFDARPRVRMRQDELDKFAASGRYGREGSFDTERLSSGLVKKGIRARAKERAIEMISERIGKDEDSKEIAEMFLGTVSALKFGPEAALTRLAIDLGKRGSRDVAERTVQELIDRGKITDEQAKSILSKLDKIAPDGLPEPLKRGVGRAARATADALDTPENRDRLEQVREAAGDAAGRAREAVGEGARNMAERGRERLRKLRERDDAGSLPSAPDDVPFGDFDPADAPVDPFSSGRRLDRRVSGSNAGRERIMDGASVTRTRLSSGETPKKDKPEKPSRPRDPDNGPMTGKFIDIFRGVKSYQEMLDRYNKLDVVYFDYETTGFGADGNMPVQLGAVRMRGGKVVERFNVFVNPGMPLGDWAKRELRDGSGNPLTDSWLAQQASQKSAHEQLIEFFGEDALLGGQYTPFDLEVLNRVLAQEGLTFTPAGVMDSKALSDELLPRWTPDKPDGPSWINPKNGKKEGTNSLGPLSEYLEVELTAWHTADADSEASAMIVQKILERAAEREDVPKHLLDVDNLPNVVTERKARHKLELDKYFADMKQYKIDNDAYEASQAGERLSSGATPGDKPEKTVRIDELLSDPAMAEELRKRSADVKALSYGERAKRFSDPNDPDAVYVVHYGASKLEGGQLDPSRSRGQVGGGIAGNTRQINDETARYMVGKRDSAKRDLSILEEMKRQVETNGVIDFDAIARTDTSDDLRTGRAKLLLGLNRRDLDYGLSTIKPADWQASNLNGRISDQENIISRLDKVADQLIADDYQYTSTYRASSAQDLFGSYGGRYAENDSAEWGDRAERSPDTGIHIFRVKIGEDATEENAVGETHLVGKHTPIASLVASNDASNKNPALDTWTGWMDMAIEADIAKRAGKVDNDAYEASQAGERLASGEMIKPVVSRQIGLSPNAVGSSYWVEQQNNALIYDSMLPRIEADRKKREAEEAARLVDYAQMLRPHNWGHQIDKPLSEMSDTELKLHLKYLDGSEPHGYPARGLDGWKAQKAEIEKEFRRRRISTNFTSAQKVEADQIVLDSNAQRAEREARNAAETAKRSEEMRARLPQPGTPEHARVEELNKNLIELEDRRIKRMNVLRNLENPTDAEKAEYEAISQLDHPYMTAKTPRLVDDYKEWEKFATAREKQKRDVLDGKMDWSEASAMLKARNDSYADAVSSKRKESEFKVGEVKPEKSARLSSGEVKQDLKSGSLKKETSEIDGTDDGYSKKKFTVHEIGDEKVVFGATRDNGADFTDIKRVPINPYEISGYDRKSPEGQEFAMKWTAAHAAHMAENDMTASTEVDALLYAAARGDSDAMKEFELLAAKGERLIEEERKLQSRESLGWSRPWEGNPEWSLNEAYDNASKAAIKKEGLEDLSIKDLYLVHETKYDLVEDADGNIILRPLGDHELKKIDGTPGEYNRDTLHFALNHLAGGHMMRQEQEGNVIIVPLSAVLEKNPDSLDALFAVDTYLVPKPGEPLVIPKGAFRTIPKGSSNPREEAEKALKEMGATHIFEAGDTHSSQGVDGKVRQIASDMGIQSTAHANIVHSYMEQKISDNEPEYNVMARELAQMSPNARMRLADNDRFSSVKTEVDNTRMFSGEVIKPNDGAAKPNTEADTPSASRLSSGAKVSPRERKKQLQQVNSSTEYLRNLDLQITEVDLRDSETGEMIKSPIFTVDGRPIVLVDVNGVRIPFYQSTGRGGKRNASGKWYPIFGIGKSDLIYDREYKRFVDRGTWFNKGDTYESIDTYYGVPEFKRIATILNDMDDLTKIEFNDAGETIPEDEVIELLRKNGSVIQAGEKLPEVKAPINQQIWELINRDLTPSSTVTRARWDYYNGVIDKIKTNRANLDIDSVSITVGKDEMSVSKESSRIKNRDVELTVKDKNGDLITVSIESELKSRFDDTEEQNLTVRMKTNGVEVGVLHARTDLGGELGNRGELTISDILVPEDYHRRGHGKLMLALAEKYNIGSEKINHSSKLSELGELFAAGTSDSSRLSSGEGPRSKKPKRFKKYKGYTLTEPDNPTGKPGEYPDDVVEAATKHRAEIEKVEAEITKLLIDLAEKNKARMEGLDFRLKALKSLMRKIAGEKDSEHGGDAEKAAKSMSDVARYTMSYEPENYVDGVKGVIAEMQKLGYDLRVKNYWKGDDPYQGINVAVTHPDGTKFELQFHTPQSVVDKEKIHLIYEDYRKETDPKKRWIMYNRMVRIANKIGVPTQPDELMNIGIVKEQPFTPR